MTPDEIAAHFTQADGSYRFARWGPPLAAVPFGLADETLPVVKGAVEAVAALAGHPTAETDPELGANLMFFFLRDWSEITATPDLGRLLPDAAGLVARLDAAGANQYRHFRFDAAGAIRAAFVFLRMDAALAEMSAEALVLGQMAQAMLVWSDAAFSDRSPLARTPQDHLILRPEIADMIRAAYDPAMPATSADAAHALRLAARMGTVA